MVTALKSAEFLCSLFGSFLIPFPHEAPWSFSHQAEQDIFALSNDDLLEQSLEHLDFRPAVISAFTLLCINKAGRLSEEHKN